MAALQDEGTAEAERKILLVDDEPDILDSLQRLIEVTVGATVRTATSGAAGLELIARERFDVILSDYKMADMDGMDFLTIVREARPEIARIMMTAYADERLAVTARSRAGVARFLSKPLDSGQVVSVLREILARPPMPPPIRPSGKSSGERNETELIDVLTRILSLPGLRSAYLLDLTGALLAEQGRAEGDEAWRMMVATLQSTADSAARSRGRAATSRVVLDLGAIQVMIQPVEGDMLLVVESDATTDPAHLLDATERASRELHEVPVRR